MADTIAVVVAAPGIGALILGIVRLRMLGSAPGGLSQALRTRPRDVKVAYFILLIGVALQVGWWVIVLQPANFPWQPVTAVIGLAAVLILIVRSRRGAP